MGGQVEFAFSRLLEHKESSPRSPSLGRQAWLKAGKAVRSEVKKRREKAREEQIAKAQRKARTLSRKSLHITPTDTNYRPMASGSKKAAPENSPHSPSDSLAESDKAGQGHNWDYVLQATQRRLSRISLASASASPPADYFVLGEPLSPSPRAEVRRRPSYSNSAPRSRATSSPNIAKKLDTHVSSEDDVSAPRASKTINSLQAPRPTPDEPAAEVDMLSDGNTSTSRSATEHHQVPPPLTRSSLQSTQLPPMPANSVATEPKKELSEPTRPPPPDVVPSMGPASQPIQLPILEVEGEMSGMPSDDDDSSTDSGSEPLVDRVTV